MTRTVPVGSRFAGAMVRRACPLTPGWCEPIIAAGKARGEVVWP